VGLPYRYIKEGHRHSLEAKPPGGNETLVTTDDDAVLLAGEHRLDESELADAARERLEFLFADAARVGWIRAELVDRDFLDHQRGQGSIHSHVSPPHLGTQMRDSRPRRLVQLRLGDQA
jgi:hypothetical protein